MRIEELVALRDQIAAESNAAWAEQRRLEAELRVVQKRAQSLLSSQRSLDTLVEIERKSAE